MFLAPGIEGTDERGEAQAILTLPLSCIMRNKEF